MLQEIFYLCIGALSLSLFFICKFFSLWIFAITWKTYFVLIYFLKHKNFCCFLHLRMFIYEITTDFCSVQIALHPLLSALTVQNDVNVKGLTYLSKMLSFLCKLPYVLFCKLCYCCKFVCRNLIVYFVPFRIILNLFFEYLTSTRFSAMHICNHIHLQSYLIIFPV